MIVFYVLGCPPYGFKCLRTDYMYPDPVNATRYETQDDAVSARDRREMKEFTVYKVAIQVEVAGHGRAASQMNSI